ncbi:hypothetical protein [Anatilimnocola floriformis]|uniref:hypothetical protein n=1 Tax=Anatilimnocola floriformis TaxID=2948575 RepID=UPI0020C3376D|nr:hypothetical protein [Anatilimnocola floriformis]
MVDILGRYRWERSDFADRVELIDRATSLRVGFAVRDLLGQCYWRVDSVLGSCENLDEAKHCVELAVEDANDKRLQAALDSFAIN